MITINKGTNLEAAGAEISNENTEIKTQDTRKVENSLLHNSKKSATRTKKVDHQLNEAVHP